MPVRFPDPLERTGGQVGILRSIVDSAVHVLGGGSGGPFDSSVPRASEIPDSVREAAAHTAQLALHQLDNIVDDMGRWSERDPEYLTEARALIVAERQKLEAQTSLIQSAHHPFSQLNGLLLQDPEGGFLAVTPGRTFGAAGKTPREAVEKFNRLYEEGPPKKEPAKRKRSRRASANSTG